MQTRVDRKYIVEAETAAKVLFTLDAGASVMEIDDQRDFAYESVYFDLRRCRATIRQRTAARTPSGFVPVVPGLGTDLPEVKTDGEQDMTVKKRIPYTFENRDTLTAEGHVTSPQRSAISLRAPCTSWRRF